MGDELTREEVLADLADLVLGEAWVDDPTYVTAPELAARPPVRSADEVAHRLLDQYRAGKLERVKIRRPGMQRWAWGYRVKGI